MKVKISETLVCIPPFISTTWDKVAFLQTEIDQESGQTALVLHLVDNKAVRIPNLDPSLVEITFAAHMKFLERSHVKQEDQQNRSPGAFLQNMMNLTPDQIASFPIRLGIGGLPEGMESMENVMQHNPQASDAPNLPAEMVDKIAAITRIMTNGDSSSFPKPEPHCNCAHCQIARAIHQMPPKKEAEGETDEPVSDDDLTFRNWDIRQSGDKLYTVTNPLDPEEHYNVYLGSPVGCTCGQAHCEHIRAVLTS